MWQYNTNTGQIDSVKYGGKTMTRHTFALLTLGAVNAVCYMYHLGRDIPAGPQTVVVDTTALNLRQASAMTLTGGTNTEVDNTVTQHSNATPSANPQAVLQTKRRAFLFGSLFSELDDGSTISAGAGYTQMGEHDLGTETVNAERTTQAQIGGLNVLVLWNAASAHWGIMGVGIRAVDYRFWGEVSSFPPRWDLSLKDAHVPIQCAGLLRRLGQGVDSPSSGLQDVILDDGPGPWQYWPLTARAGTQYTLSIGDHPNYWRFAPFPSSGVDAPVFSYGSGDLGPFLPPSFQISSDGDFGFMKGDVGSAAKTAAVDFLFKAPKLGELTMQYKDYSGFYWAVNISGNFDSVAVAFTDPETGPTQFPNVSTAIARDGELHHIRLQTVQSGANTNWAVLVDGVSVSSGTQNGYNLNGISMVQFFYNMVPESPKLQTPVALGHVAVWDTTLPSAAALTLAANGYTGETAGRRIERILALTSHSFTPVGNLDDTLTMGPQHSEALLSQIRDAESTDLGVLTEPRDALGLLYRTRASLYDQAATVTLDFGSNELVPPFEPIDDDQNTRNDITGVRRDGGSVRLTDTTGPLSTLDPPAGVGRYKDEVTLNVETDAHLPAVASWLLHLGTVDEARYPSVTVNLLSPDISAALETALLSVDVGDRIVITNSGSINVYDDVSLLVIGYTETIGPVEHVITFHCAPATPYDVAVWGSGVGTGPDRYDTDGSELTSSVTTTGTSLSVTKTGSSLWTNVAGEFPFDILVGGERMTVTNITSATSPQTFTVTRSVNGVVKTHAAGAAVRLWKTPRYAL